MKNDFVLEHLMHEVVETLIFFRTTFQSTSIQCIGGGVSYFNVVLMAVDTFKTRHGQISLKDKSAVGSNRGARNVLPVWSVLCVYDSFTF